MKLTQRVVDSIEPEDREVTHWDDQLPRFGLRVRPNGRKVFIVMFRAQGRLRKLTVGSAQQWTVKQAREQAATLLRRVDSGEDPAEARQEARTAPTVGDLCKRYLTDHATPKKAPTSVAADRRMIDKYILPAFGRRKVAEISRADIDALHRKLKKTPVAANRTLFLCSTLFNLAEEWELREQNSNPCRRVKKYREEPRQRYLSTEELGRLGTALREAEKRVGKGNQSQTVIDAIRLLVLTGCRKGEILGLRWGWIDWERRAIAFPHSKTGQKFVPLNAPAIAILERRRKKAKGEFVLPGVDPSQPLKELKSTWDTVRKKAGIEDVRIHDLRHSFAAMGAGAGISLPMIGGLLGHSKPSTTARYAHLASDPLHEATNEIGERLAASLEGGEGK